VEGAAGKAGEHKAVSRPPHFERDLTTTGTPGARGFDAARRPTRHKTASHSTAELTAAGPVTITLSPCHLVTLSPCHLVTAVRGLFVASLSRRMIKP